MGLLFVVLSALLFIIAYLRSRHSAHDFADRYRGAAEFDVCIKTKGQEGGRIYGRPFKTAGWIVIELTTVVALAEMALLALIVQHKIYVSQSSLSFFYIDQDSILLPDIDSLVLVIFLFIHLVILNYAILHSRL